MQNIQLNRTQDTEITFELELNGVPNASRSDLDVRFVVECDSYSIFTKANHVTENTYTLSFPKLDMLAVGVNGCNFQLEVVVKDYYFKPIHGVAEIVESGASSDFVSQRTVPEEVDVDALVPEDEEVDVVSTSKPVEPEVEPEELEVEPVTTAPIQNPANTDKTNDGVPATVDIPSAAEETSAIQTALTKPKSFSKKKNDNLKNLLQNITEEKEAKIIEEEFIKAEAQRLLDERNQQVRDMLKKRTQH